MPVRLNSGSRIRRLRLAGLTPAAITIIAVVTLAAMGVSARVWFTSIVTTGRAKSTATQVQAATPVVMTIPSFVVPGLAVSLSPGAVSNDGAISNLTYSLTNQSGSKVTSLRLMLLEFNPAGKLRRTEGWIEPLDLNTAATTDVTIRLKKRVTPGQRLVLAVEALTGPGGTKEVAPVDLIQAVAAALGGITAPPPTVKTDPGKVQDDYGSSYCNNALRAALSGSKSSDKANDAVGISAFSCKPGSRFYAFSYNR